MRCSLAIEDTWDMLGRIPDEWGPKFECDGGAVTRTSTGPNAIRFTAPSHMALVMFTPQPGRQMALGSDHRAVGVAPVGALEIIPLQSDLFARWTVHKQCLLVCIEAARLERLAGLEFDKDLFELHPPKLGYIDDEAYTLARWMRQEIEGPEICGDERLDALITVFATHLLRKHSSLTTRRRPSLNGGLPPGTWRRLNDFIQAHLSERLTLERLAAVARLSPSHFARAFRQTAGQSPHQYVIASRLSHARNMIAKADLPLDEIARRAGFSSHSHLTSTMKRAWNATPSDLRRNGVYLDVPSPEADSSDP